jgi:hypothetical protein
MVGAQRIYGDEEDSPGRSKIRPTAAAGTEQHCDQRHYQEDGYRSRAQETHGGTPAKLAQDSGASA